MGIPETSKESLVITFFVFFKTPQDMKKMILQFYQLQIIGKVSMVGSNISKMKSKYGSLPLCSVSPVEPDIQRLYVGILSSGWHTAQALLNTPLGHL